MNIEDDEDYPVFSHTACEFFPCHDGIAPDQFNCLFCYCPLYTLGPDCGGDFFYNEHEVKCCDNCSRPHCGEQGTRLVMERFDELVALAHR